MNVVAIKTTIVETKSEENDKNIVATHKRMLRHNTELKADISVMTKENYIVAIKVVESEISIATENFSVTTENGR